MADPTHRVIDVDSGYAALMRAIKELDVEVYVGILQDEGSEFAEGGGITLAGYAAANEFGSDDGRIPERSFMRSTVAENEPKYIGELIAAARAVAIDGADVMHEFGLVGLGAEIDIKDKIRDLRDPPNAPLTLALKYPGDNPLIETGRMRMSISHMVSK